MWTARRRHVPGGFGGSRGAIVALAEQQRDGEQEREQARLQMA